VDEIHCRNTRKQLSFSVAAAYVDWFDLSEGQAVELPGRKYLTDARTTCTNSGIRHHWFTVKVAYTLE